MKRIFLIAICILLSLSACSNGSSSSAELTNQKDSSNTEPISDQKGEEKNEQILLDDDCVKVTYMEVFEEPSIDGTFYFRLQVENKTERVITIYLLDPAVNKVSTLALSGVPMVIQPGGKSLTPFFFTYTNLDISSISELEEISFKVKVDDNDTYEEIEVSDVVIVSF